MSAFPTTPVPQRLRIESMTQTLVSVTQSLKTQRRSRGGQRWKLSLSWAGLAIDDAQSLWAAIVALRGQYTTCTFTVRWGQRGTFGGTPLVNNASGYAAGLSAVAIDGCSNSITRWIRAGDYLKFGGHTKVYMATADANSDGSGNVSLAIFPALHTALVNNEALTVQQVPFTVALADDSAGMDLEPGLIGALGVTLLEVW